jgi:hypothetical protein
MAALLAASMWFYVDHVYLGHQLAEAAANDNPQGIFSDFYPRWLGAREMLLHHRNPYSLEVTRDIQIGYYGRPLDPRRPGDPKDQMGFAYPLYVVFLLAPTITLPFPALRVAVHWFLILLTASAIPLWLRVLRWRASLPITTILVMLTLGTLPVVQGIKLEQLTLLVGGMVAGSACLLVSDYLVLAGILLAFATIKPHLVLLMTAWLILWACGNYRERRRFLWSFGVTMTILCAGAEVVMPGWVREFVKALAAYREYTGRPVSILAIFTTPALSLFLSVLMLVGLAVACWRARRVSADHPAFAFVFSLVLVVTLAVIPMTSLYNQILLLPAILLLVRHRAFLWGRDRLTRLIGIIAGSLIYWPWLAALVLSVASLFMAPEVVQKAWAAPLWTSMTIPLGVLLLLVRFGMLTQPSMSARPGVVAHPIRLPSA